MTNPMLVTGGTGVLGRVVVRRLLDAGQPVRVLSRGRRPADPEVQHLTGDLRTGAGVDTAVADVDTVVHCADPAGPLVDAAKRAGNPHIVYISIVGIERIPLGYYQSKLADERYIEASGLPWSILRATQFHDLIAYGMRQVAKLPVVIVPSGWSFQPVDVREVAARMVELALGEPAGRVPDLAGPQVCSVKDLARIYLRTVGKRRPILPIPLPGQVFGAYRRGFHLAPDHATGRITFDGYLAGQPAAGTWPSYSDTASDGRQP